MPIYEYQCRACGKVTDVRHGFDETNSQACPACGGALDRRFSPAGIVFKGSGFYATDSRKSSEPAKSTGSSATKPETKSDAKSDGAASSDSSSATPPKTDTAAA